MPSTFSVKGKIRKGEGESPKVILIDYVSEKLLDINWIAVFQVFPQAKNHAEQQELLRKKKNWSLGGEACQI